MENYILNLLFTWKDSGDKHMLTKQGVWGGALFTLKTLEYTRRALEKHDFNLFQLHASILKK